MRLVFSERVERARLPQAGPAPSESGDRFGFFSFLTDDRPRERLLVMVSAGHDDARPEHAMKWEHVSVSHRTRCPTWGEMSWVKELFFDDEEAVMQLHPRKSQYVNYHPFCLHMWRPWPELGTILEPPTLAVGILNERAPGYR
jgi:hypothetical protein